LFQVEGRKKRLLQDQRDPFSKSEKKVARIFSQNDKNGLETFFVGFLRKNFFFMQKFFSSFFVKFTHLQEKKFFHRKSKIFL